MSRTERKRTRRELELGIASIHRAAEKGYSRKSGFRFTEFSETDGGKREGRGIYTPALSSRERALPYAWPVLPATIVVLSTAAGSVFVVALSLAIGTVAFIGPPGTCRRNRYVTGCHKHHHERAQHENLNDALHILL